MLGESDARVVVRRLGRGPNDKLAARSQLLVGQPDELAPDTLTRIGLIHRQGQEVAAGREIGQ